MSNRRKNIKNSRSKQLEVAAALLFPVLLLIVISVIPRDTFNQCAPMASIGGVIILALIIGIGFFVGWFREVEKDELKSIDLRILAIENEVSYLEQNEVLSKLISRNEVGFETSEWDPHYVVYQEHVKGESWIFDTQKSFGFTVALIKYQEQEIIPMLIGIAPQYVKPTKKPKTKNIPRRQQDGRIKNHLSYVDFNAVQNFEREILGGKTLYTLDYLADRAKKFVEKNPSIQQIINMQECHFLAFYERYAMLAFKDELESSSENYRRINTRINRILRLKGTPIQVEDEPVDEIKKLKGKL